MDLFLKVLCQFWFKIHSVTLVIVCWSRRMKWIWSRRMKWIGSRRMKWIGSRRMKWIGSRRMKWIGINHVDAAEKSSRRGRIREEAVPPPSPLNGGRSPPFLELRAITHFSNLKLRSKEHTKNSSQCFNLISPFKFKELCLNLVFVFCFTKAENFWMVDI